MSTLRAAWHQRSWNQEQVCFFQRLQSTHGIFLIHELHAKCQKKERWSLSISIHFHNSFTASALVPKASIE